VPRICSYLAGAPDFDIVYRRHSQANQVVLLLATAAALSAGAVTFSGQKAQSPAHAWLPIFVQGTDGRLMASAWRIGTKAHIGCEFDASSAPVAWIELRVGYAMFQPDAAGRPPSIRPSAAERRLQP